MKRRSQAQVSPTQFLRDAALRYPEAQEGIACADTTAEKRTIKVRNKAFVFLGVADAMLKLHASLAEAAQLAAQKPDCFRVGAHGWVTVTFGNAEVLPVDRWVRWVDESYRLLAPKQLARLLPARDVVTEPGDRNRT